MSDDSTKRMIEVYMQDASAPQFLAGFFQSPARNFHTSENVELDILREDEDIAVVVEDISVGGRENVASRYTNKEFTPPIFNETGTINAYNQIKRRAGVDPFQDPNYGANAIREAFRIARLLESKIRRSVELMASQVLQTGALTLIDSDSVTRYSLDFLPKATHNVDVTQWAADGSTGEPLADVEALARVIRKDGKKNPTKLVFGAVAWQRWFANADVKEAFRNDGLKDSMGLLTPQVRGEGATFMGMVRTGSYNFEMWLYEADFKHPDTGVLTPYITDDTMIMLSDAGRLDLTYGAIPRPFGADARAMPFLPGRMSNTANGLDLTLNAWIEPNGRTMKLEVGTRPLTIPTAIDTFGTLHGIAS